MTPEERDALIDATVEACAKIAENFRPEGDEVVGMISLTGARIAAAIRKEFRQP